MLLTNTSLSFPVFNQLEEYKAKHGDCLVPSRYEENYKLGKWVETQRYEYTKLQRVSLQTGEGEDAKPGANPRLTAERRARLEGIGFEWKVKHKMKRYYDRQWDTMFEKLLKYKEVSKELKIMSLRYAVPETRLTNVYNLAGEWSLPCSQALSSGCQAWYLGTYPAHPIS